MLIGLTLLLLVSNDVPHAISAASTLLLNQKYRERSNFEPLASSLISWKRLQGIPSSLISTTQGCQSLSGSESGNFGDGDACIFSGTTGNTSEINATTMCYYGEQWMPDTHHITHTDNVEAAAVFTLLPTVFLLGAQKCASTSLAFQMVNLMPQLVIKDGEKEQHYFDAGRSTYDAPGYALKLPNDPSVMLGCKNESTTWLFNDACASKDKRLDMHAPAGNGGACLTARAEAYTGPAIGFDATPGYLESAFALKNMANMYGESGSLLRFVVILRDPVDRLQSWFTHFQPAPVFETWARDMLGKIRGTGSLCMGVGVQQAQTDGCWEILGATDSALGGDSIAKPMPLTTQMAAFEKGIYVWQLQRWAAMFGAEQFLIVSFMDYMSHANDTLLAIADHIGVLTPETRHVLEEVDGPLDENSGSWRLTEETNLEGFNNTMSAELRSELSSFYAPYDSELLEFMNQSGMQTVGPHFAF
jgi:hypothetical protein